MQTTIEAPPVPEGPQRTQHISYYEPLPMFLSSDRRVCVCQVEDCDAELLSWYDKVREKRS